jgi:hypothetical protein
MKEKRALAASLIMRGFGSGFMTLLKKSHHELKTRFLWSSGLVKSGEKPGFFSGLVL